MSATARSDSKIDQAKVETYIIYKYLPPPYHYGVPEGQPIFQKRSFKERVLEKTAKNPLIPIGMLATTAALVNGIRMMQRGDRQRSQLMMRYRVSGQAFTIAVFTIGIMFGVSFYSVNTDKQIADSNETPG